MHSWSAANALHRHSEPLDSSSASKISTDNDLISVSQTPGSSPMVLIVTSYARILASILSRSSSSGRGKTFSTCASHLTVVIFLYSSAMFSYMNPRSTHGPDKDKPFSLLYTIIMPMCNPIIYSFRNKEMKGAMGRALGRGNLASAAPVQKETLWRSFFQ
ncbi:Olfactory receptor 10AD1 [Lemmus lemmus]